MGGLSSFPVPGRGAFSQFKVDENRRLTPDFCPLFVLGLVIIMQCIDIVGEMQGLIDCYVYFAKTLQNMGLYSYYTYFNGESNHVDNGQQADFLQLWS